MKSPTDVITNFRKFALSCLTAKEMARLDRLRHKADHACIDFENYPWYKHGWDRHHRRAVRLNDRYMRVLVRLEKKSLARGGQCV